MLRVLTYHRVGSLFDDTNADPRLISATPEAFDQQLTFLAKHYQVLSIEEVLEAVTRKTRPPSRSVLITFDDGYRDFGETAWPILKRHRLPVTLFVPTYYPAHPEQGFWWDRLFYAFKNTCISELQHPRLGLLRMDTQDQRGRTLRQLLRTVEVMDHYQGMTMVQEICQELDVSTHHKRTLLNWNELRQLAAEGVSMGAHTRSHAILTHLAPQECANEIAGSQEDLRREIGHVLPIFCYPSGRHNDAIVRILEQAGFVMAFTTMDGQNHLDSADLLRLRRTNITPRTSMPIFKLRLMPAIAFTDQLRRQAMQMVNQF